MDKSWIHRSRFSKEYKEGVKSFLHIARNHLDAENKTRCPCRDCQNSCYHNLASIRRHLLKHGMAFSYKNWIYHGEQPNINCPPRAQSSPTIESTEEDDNMMGLVNDVFGPTPMDMVPEQPDSQQNNANDASRFDGLFGDISEDAPFTASLPQHRTNPPTNESMYVGASCGTKRGSSTVLAPQTQRNPTSHEPTILTSIGTSINVPQSQMNMSSEPTSPILDGTSTDGAPNSFKKVRGKTRLASERALHAAGRKLPVTIKAEDGRPSGANSRFFVTEIGFIIRTFAPLQYECFGNIPDQEKELLVFRLLTKYDVDTSKPYVMAFIYTMMSKRYTEFRNRLKKYFLRSASAEEARKHRPDDVKKQEDCDYICDLFITNEKYKNRSAKNAINRSKLLFNYCGGSKSFVHYQYEVSSEDDEHEYEDDEWMKNAVPKGPRGLIENEMIALQKEQEGLDEVKRLSEKEICMKVLGKWPACVFSFKPTNRAEELEAENEKLKSELQEMKATMASVKDMQKMINQLQDFQKRIESVSLSTPTDACMD